PVVLRRGIEIEIEHEASGAAVDVDAVVGDAQCLVEQARRLLARVAGGEQLRIGLRPVERGAQRLDQVLLRTPEILRAELHHVGGAGGGARQPELAVQFEHWRTKSHSLPPANPAPAARRPYRNSPW